MRELPGRDVARTPAPAPVALAPDWLGTWDWRKPCSGETIREWAARIDRQEAEITRRAAAWLRFGRLVRILYDVPPAGAAGLCRFGVIDALCPDCFPAHAYVRLLPPKRHGRGVVMLPLERLAPYG